MVVHARLLWVRRLVAGGTAAHVAVSSASATGKGKFLIRVSHGLPATSDLVRTLLVAQIDHIILQSAGLVAVDRGHHHVSSNVSEIAIWLSPRTPGAGHMDEGRPPPPDGGDDAPPGDGDDDNDDEQDNSKRRRTHLDPWHRGSGDPWSQVVPPPVPSGSDSHPTGSSSAASPTSLIATLTEKCQDALAKLRRNEEQLERVRAHKFSHLLLDDALHDQLQAGIAESRHDFDILMASLEEQFSDGALDLLRCSDAGRKFASLEAERRLLPRTGVRSDGKLPTIHEQSANA